MYPNRQVYRPHIDHAVLDSLGIYNDTAEKLIFHEGLRGMMENNMLSGTDALVLGQDLNRMRYSIEGVREGKHPYWDADETIFSPRELVQIRQDPFFVKYPEFKAEFIVPIDSTGDTGAEYLGFERQDWHQKAGWIKSEAEDYPLNTVSKQQGTLPVHTFGGAFQIDLQEIRKAAFGRKSPLSAKGPSITERKTHATIKGIRMVEEEIIAKGFPDLEIEGFYNNDAWPSFTIPTNGTGSSDRFSKKTAQQNLDDLKAMFSAIRNKELYTPNTLLAEQAYATYLRTTPYDGVFTGGNFPGQRTIWNFFKAEMMADFGNIDLIGYNRVLDGSPAGKSRIMMYKKHPDHMQQMIPQPIEVLGPYPKSSTLIEVRLRMRHGGVHFRDPLCGVKADISRT